MQEKKRYIYIALFLYVAKENHLKPNYAGPYLRDIGNFLLFLTYLFACHILGKIKIKNKKIKALLVNE